MYVNFFSLYVLVGSYLMELLLLSLDIPYWLYPILPYLIYYDQPLKVLLFQCPTRFQDLQDLLLSVYSNHI